MRRFFTLFRLVMAILAGALSLGQVASVRAETAWKPNDDDALLFDVRLGKYRLGDGVRGYQTPDGVCVDLADIILALDVPVRLDKKLRRATGWAFNESHSILIDRELNIEQIANSKKKLADSAVIDTPEGWCAKAEAVSRWFGVAIEPNLSTATIIIKANDKLPVELAAERRERSGKLRPVAAFDLKSLPQSPTPFGGFKTPSVDAVISLGGLRDKQRGMTGSAQYELFASGEIGPVAYQARLASDRNGVPDSVRLRAYRTDPEGGLLGPLKATEVAVGDIQTISSTLVAQSRIGRGAMLTNRPVGRPDSFDRTDFRGELPIGWDAELYRNDQLIAIAFDRANGRYEFLDVDLLFGQNRFEVVLYGPQGQVKREERIIMVGQDSIPPKSTWYWAGVAQDGRDLFNFGGSPSFGSGRWRGTVALERGLNSRTSIAAALNSIYLAKVGRRNFGEASIRRSIGPALIQFGASSDFRGGFALSSQLLAQLGRTYINAESVRAFRGFTSDIINERIRGQHRIAVDQTLRIGRTVVPVSVSANYFENRDGSTALALNSRMSMQMGRITLSGETQWRKQKRPYGPDPDDELDAGLLVNARMGRVRVRGEARFQLAPTRRFERATIITEWRGRSGSRHSDDWRAEIGYDRRLDRARVGLGYIRRFDKFSIMASAEAASDGAVAAGLNLSFSFGPDPRRNGGVRVTSARIAAQGQVLARVYRDLNADGIRQPDEPWEKNVQLAAGRVPVERLTDANGEVIIDDLAPFGPVLIGIDASSLEDPLVQPKGPGVVVTLRPGITSTVELGLTSAGEVDGTLVRDGGGGFEGVELELVDVSGNVISRTRSDFDGFFLFETVPYGNYAIRIGQTSAAIAGVSPRLSGQAALNHNNPVAHLGTLIAETDALRSVKKQE